MALINCPECGREISDKAVACLGCGYPVAEMASKSSTDILLDNLYQKYPKEKVKAIKEFREVTGADLNTARDAIYTRYEGKTAKALELEKKEKIKAQNKPAYENASNSLHALSNLLTKDKTARCPKCGSTSITYIEKKSGFLGVSLFPGVVAGKSSSKGVCKCLKCGKEWKK